MFTGIVEERGRVRSLDRGGNGSRLLVECRVAASDAAVGSSIAVNGVCLTVVERDAVSLGFDLAPETLARTSLGGLAPGAAVNLERPVTLATRLGGHLVQGHVDGIGTVEAVTRDASGVTMVVDIPPALGRYVPEKGSVAVDGVSLTVALVEGSAFTVALVPHTLAATTLGERRPGDAVNLEMDVISKYLERLTRREE